MDDNKSYKEKLEEKIQEMYEQYLNDKLSLVFNTVLGKIFYNTIRYKVLNDITKIDCEKLEKIYEQRTLYFLYPSCFEEGYVKAIGRDHRVDLMDMNGNFYFDMTYQMPYYVSQADIYGIWCKDGELHRPSEGWFLANLEQDKYSNLEGYYFFSVDDKKLKIGPFTSAREFIDGFAVVEHDGKWNILNHDMQFVFPKSYKYISNIDFGRVRVHDGLKSKTIYLGMKDYQVKKAVRGYICSNEKRTFKIKYRPVKMFDDNSVLCFHNNHYYLCDVANDKYQILEPLVPSFTYSWGSVNPCIVYDDNFIYDKENKIVYFPYNGKLINITKYYKDHLLNNTVNNFIFSKGVRVNRCVKDILTLNEFHCKNIDEIEEMMKREREKNKEILEKQKEDMLQVEIENRKWQERENQRKSEENIRNGLEKLKEALELLKNNAGNIGIKKIQYDIDFIVNDEYLEIPKEIMPALKYIDLSLVDFTNVKVSGIDFRGCNVEHINPQNVYNRDLRGCDFRGMYISPFMKFDDVDIRGCKFSYDTNDKTMDVFNQSLARAIYDETTLFNGVPLSHHIEKNRSSAK